MKKKDRKICLCCKRTPIKDWEQCKYCKSCSRHIISIKSSERARLVEQLNQLKKEKRKLEKLIIKVWLSGNTTSKEFKFLMELKEKRK